MNMLKLVGLSAAMCLGVSASAIGAGMTKAEHETAAETISARYAADQAACKSLSGNTKDICSEEAKGREAVSKAELEARYKPTDSSRRDVSMAKAKASRDVAKEKCDDLAGNAEDVCLKEAEAAFVTATENAKLVETTAEANATARETTAEAREDGASEKRDANYAAAKEKCDAFAGDAKDSCISNAKARHGQ